MSATAEPLSPFARAILSEIGARPVRCEKLIPVLRDLFLARRLIHQTVDGRLDIYAITPAGDMELGGGSEQLKGDEL